MILLFSWVFSWNIIMYKIPLTLVVFSGQIHNVHMCTGGLPLPDCAKQYLYFWYPSLWSVFTHDQWACFWTKIKETVCITIEWIPCGLFGDTNMSSVPLLRDTNMAAWRHMKTLYSYFLIYFRTNISTTCVLGQSKGPSAHPNATSNGRCNFWCQQWHFPKGGKEASRELSNFWKF